MRVVFMGTPAFAATILDDLAEQHDVAAVYTRPDAVRGRGKRLEPSPVKAAAERRGLRVLTPRTLRDEAAQRELASFAPDVICVAAYGAILPHGGGPGHRRLLRVPHRHRRRQKRLRAYR